MTTRWPPLPPSQPDSAAAALRTALECLSHSSASRNTSAVRGPPSRMNESMSRTAASSPSPWIGTGAGAVPRSAMIPFPMGPVRPDRIRRGRAWAAGRGRDDALERSSRK